MMSEMTREVAVKDALETLEEMSRWPNNSAEKRALDLAIAALKGPVIDDDMVERALDFWFTEPESTGINYGDWRKWSTAQQQRDTMRNALTAALHIPIAELNQLVSGVDLEEPTNAE